MEGHIKRLNEQGLFKSAELLCGTFDKKTPDQLVLYADALHGLKQYRRALQYYEQAQDAGARQKGKEVDIREKMAQCYIGLGQEKDALKSWEQVPVKSRSLECHIKMGELYMKQLKTKHATQCYQNALVLEPLAVEASIALTKLGVDPKWNTSSSELWWVGPLLEGFSNSSLNSKQFDLPAALKKFSELSSNFPHNVNFLLFKADAQLQVTDSGAALETFGRVRVLDSLNVVGMDTMALIMHKRSLTTQLRELVHQLLSIGDNLPEVWVASALYLEQTHQKERALQCIEKALALDPRHLNALLTKGFLSVSMGLLEQGVKCYRAAHEIEKTMSVFEGLVDAYLAESEDFRSALSAAKEAFQKMPKNPRALTLIGRVLSPSLEQRGQAIKAFSKALAIDPDHFDALLHLTKINCEMKQYDEAIDQLQRYLARHSNELAHVTLGQMLILKGDFEQALVHFHKALVLCPNYELALKGIERLESNLKGDDDDPREASFEEALYD